MRAETQRWVGATLEGNTSFTQMLANALEWGGVWRNHFAELKSTATIRDRDVVALGLIAQIVGAKTLFCSNSELSRTMPAPNWLSLASLSDTSMPGPNLVLAPLQDISRGELTNRAAAGDWIVCHDLGQALPIPAAGARIRPLAMINPAFWNSDLALYVTEEHKNVDMISSRLQSLLGNQNLDTLELYEEVCRLREMVRAPARQSRAERDLMALRRYVRGLIERAAITARRESARAKPGVPIDWSAAFLVPPEVTGSPRETQPNEMELRARRARIEAEFLRGQLRAATIPRDIDHHDLISSSGFFDIPWYAETYDVLPEEAVRHYLDSGYIKEYDPSPYFSTSAYFAAYPDVRRHGFNPLLHYLMDGIYEGRTIDPPATISETIWSEGFKID